MLKNLIFCTLVTALLAAGSYGIFSIIEKKSPVSELIETSKTDDAANGIVDLAAQFGRPKTTAAVTTSTASARQVTGEGLLSKVKKLLDNGEYSRAVNAVDDQYQSLSREQIQEFENLFLKIASELKQSEQTDQAITLLTPFNNSFNNLEGWTLLSDIYVAKKNWPAAVNSLLKATALEYRPEQLERLMSNLVAVASQVRFVLEGQKDELAINQLYRKLYEHHPDNARFQLELALSYVRLKDLDSGKGLLEPLQYDAQYGAIAKTTLASLEDNLAVETKQSSQNDDQKSRNEIVVPLLRSGNSFFVNAMVNNRQLRLLLDTGASITALSESAIDALNLKPSGRSIQLNTANGVRSSELFRTDRIRLGDLSIKNLSVAGIKLGSNTGIDGLLGTDLLNQIDSRYSYVIDNQRNALIFISK